MDAYLLRLDELADLRRPLDRAELVRTLSGAEVARLVALYAEMVAMFHVEHPEWRPRQGFRGWASDE